jgi:hypothetical protein
MDTEEKIQAEIRAMLPELDALRARCFALRDRAAALPGFAEAEAENDRTGNVERMTLALRLHSDLEQAAGPDPNSDDRAFAEHSISDVIWHLSRAARETEETAQAS